MVKKILAFISNEHHRELLMSIFVRYCRLVTSLERKHEFSLEVIGCCSAVIFVVIWIDLEKVKHITISVWLSILFAFQIVVSLGRITIVTLALSSILGCKWVIASVRTHS